MKNFDWKKWLPEAGILLLFAVASAIYFWPALEGKIVYAGDNINGTAAVQESIAFHEETGDYSYWSGSMFSGMPNYQTGGHGGYLVDKILRPVRYVLSMGNRNTFFIFLYYLIAFYLLFRTFKVERWTSVAGAFAVALSSYFFVIIAAQHHGKCFSITWMTLVLIGFLLIYRKQYGWGALLTMFFTYIGFFQHPQMSYYICMLIGVLFFGELAIAIRDKEWKHLTLATLIFGASFGICMGIGSANIFANQEYAKETMRGGHSDLKKSTDEGNKTAGLDLDYATAWSYGIPETMTFLIPNYMGGASGYNLGEGSQLEKDLKKMGVQGRQAKQFCQSAPTYWGEKAFTSGPVYMGAIICFLFLLGLLIVKGPYKWALLAATLFSLCLAWGHNFMSLTELFFNYFPMYNKFRAVESILIVAEITMPLLAMLALRELNKADKTEQEAKWHKTALFIAGGVTAGICLFVALFGHGFDVTSSYDAAWKGSVGDQIYDAILSQRRQMLTSDAWRSLAFVVLGFALTYWYAFGKKTENGKKQLVFGLALTALVVADMWTVDKRFCNNDNFVNKKDTERTFKMLPYEKELLEKDTTYFRVLNLTVNTFNEARTSYYLKSIGGYHPAKLRRYQDLIEEHISKMNWNVLNMLNTKYIISKGQDGQPFPYLNDQAFGNCWFVDSLVAVSSANAESDALNTLDLRHVAVYDETYASNAHIFDVPAVNTLQAFDEERIVCTSNNPKQLTYTAQVERPRTAVFSEIYYPYGWKATVDGEPAEIFRVNYILRALNLPAGEHDIVFTFEPDSVRKGNMLSLGCFIIFLLTLAGVVGYNVYRRRKTQA